METTLSCLTNDCGFEMIEDLFQYGFGHFNVSMVHSVIPYTHTLLATCVKVGCLVIGFFFCQRAKDTRLLFKFARRYAEDKSKNTAKLNISMNPRLFIYSC